MKYEAHITVEPMVAESFSYEDFAAYVAEAGWRASKFEHDDVDGIAGKWFLSCAYDERDVICRRTTHSVEHLTKRGFTVLRWKIEETLFDSKHGDKLCEVGCTHDWRYSGTDYHGSHKGEDAYRCRLCGKQERRP